MELQIVFRNVPQSSHRELSERFAELAKKHLEPHLSRFAPDVPRLRVVVEANEHHSNLQTVGLHLSIPGGQFTSEKTADSLLVAAKEAVADLERQLIEQLERTRNEDEWTRTKRRENLRRLRVVASNRPRQERRRFSEAIRPYLPMLRRLARFEIDHLRARGQLTSNYPSVDDLTDEVLARAYRDLNTLKRPEDVQRKLFGIVIEAAREEAARDRNQRRALSLEGPPPREPTDIEIDETFYDFFQPDDVTKVHDLSADDSSDPEEALIRREMRQHFASVLANLPATWRRATILAQVEGLPLATVARILNASEAQVRDWLDRADSFIRARLSDEGIIPASSDQLSYLEKAPLLEDLSDLEHRFDTALGSSDQSDRAAPG